MAVFLNRDPHSRELACFSGTIIVLEGLIAAGKSTLGLSLYRFLNRIGIPAEWVVEDMPQSLLNLYLSDMQKYAFSFQVIVAQERVQKYKYALEMAKQGKVVFIDRGLWGDLAFATMQKDKGFFTETEFATYLDLISGKHPEPHYTLFLECPPEICFERLKIRANSSEVNGYSLEYFQELNESYQKVLKSQCQGFIRLNWDAHQEIRDGQVSDELCKKVLLTIRDGVQ